MSTPAFGWVIALPLIAAPGLYLASRLSRRPAVARWLCLLTLAGDGWLYFMVTRTPGAAGAQAFFGGSAVMQWDGLAQLLAALALTLGTLVALFSTADIAGAPDEEKYYALLLVLVGVLIGVGCARDLFNLWIWFEALAVSTYLLVAFHREPPTSLEATVKYLVQSAAGTSLVLLGIALVLMQTGTLDLAAIPLAAKAAGSPALLAAGGLFVVGLGVKAALVPLHSWLPDAHAQAPSGISAMLSGVVIAAGLVALLRAVAPLAALSDLRADVGWLFLGLGAVNMLYGNLLALRQVSLKRLLAYSSLSHIGYVLLGIGVALSSGQPAGAAAGMLHLLNHGLMKGLAFLSAGALVYALQTSTTQHASLKTIDLAGAAQRYPLVALALSVALLSLAGLPPLAGFTSKWQIFAAGFATGHGTTELLVAFAAFNSVLSLAYYAPVLNILYRQQPSEAVRAGRLVPAVMKLPLLALSLLIVVVGLRPDLLQGLAAAAGSALMAAIGS